MFTGIIEDIGEIRRIVGRADAAEMCIGTSLKGIEEGESISVDGVCLTVRLRQRDAFTVDCSRQTLNVSTLKDKREGDRVNLERALRVGGRLGGHLVLGHVDGVGKIVEKRREGTSILLTILPPQGLGRYIVERGSIAVDGVSLTVLEARGNRFTVNIVPYTALKTTLAEKRVGDLVNIEADVIGKFVENLLRQGGGAIDRGLLERHGFIKEVGE